MKRAVVLNCSCFFFFFFTTSGHPKRRSQEKEKEKLKNNEPTNQKERKVRRPERNQITVCLKQKREKMVGPRALWPPDELDVNERRVPRQNAKASLPNGANKL